MQLLQVKLYSHATIVDLLLRSCHDFGVARSQSQKSSRGSTMDGRIQPTRHCEILVKAVCDCGKIHAFLGLNLARSLRIYYHLEVTVCLFRTQPGPELTHLLSFGSHRGTCNVHRNSLLYQTATSGSFVKLP